MAPSLSVIPASSIIAMIAAIIFVVIIPIVIAIFLIRRYTMNLSAIILGGMMFIVFDTIFLSLFDSFVLGTVSTTLNEFIKSSPLNYTVYYAFIHALLYTAGFSVAFRMIMHSDTGVGSGIAVGLGCGGVSAILGTAYPMVNNVIAAMQINKSGADAFLANAEASNKQNMIDAVNALKNSNAADFLFSGYEKIMLFIIFVSAGVIIHLAITHRSAFAYLYAAMGMLLVVYIPSALYSTGVITSALVLESLMTLCAAAAAGIAVYQVRKYGSNPLRY
jgi:uncharacterized membrane protein YhfC